MRVGVLQFFSWPGRRGALEEVYARALERIEVMDRSGYDAVWLAEHHFTDFSVCPSIHMMGTLAAARTRRLRIGTAVSLAAFYHPLRLAEEVALLDVLSGGRVEWGAGRGFDRTEFAAFGVTPEESASRFRETVEIVLRAWTSERLSFAGRHFRFEDVEVLPKPLQRPHPPVWMASSSEAAIEWAAEHGFSILMDPHSAHTEIARKQRHYFEHVEKAGGSPAERKVGVARLVAIGDDRREAEEIARRGAAWIVDSYADLRHRPVLPFGGLATDPASDPVERYLRGVVLRGTADEVVDEILRLRETMRLDVLLAAPLSQGTFRRFTDDVLPRIGAAG